MAGRPKTKREKLEEEQLRNLTHLLESRGISVRREKLSRGPAYRVKSGDCMFTGQKHVFVDRRLPREQQISVLVDYLVDFEVKLENSEAGLLSNRTRHLIDSRQPKQAA